VRPWPAFTTQVLVVAGGVGVGHKLRSMVREAQAVQKQLTKVGGGEVVYIEGWGDGPSFS